MNNKRGQGLSTNAIVLIILAVIVLVVIILGFTLGWSNLAPWISSENVDSLVNQCGIACSTSSIYDFCAKERTLKAEGQEEVIGTCFSFATDFPNYGFEECPAITCETEE
jgi:hypothetical protein